MSPDRNQAAAEGEREAFEAVVAKEAGPSATKRWLNTDAYENSRINDNRLGWVWCLEWLARTASKPQPKGLTDEQVRAVEPLLEPARAKLNARNYPVNAEDFREYAAVILALVPKRAALQAPAPAHGRWISADDIDRLVRELDVALNGEAKAARQASLCDLVAQVKAAPSTRLADAARELSEFFWSENLGHVPAALVANLREALRGVPSSAVEAPKEPERKRTGTGRWPFPYEDDHARIWGKAEQESDGAASKPPVQGSGS